MLEKKWLGVQPLFILPGFSLHFPLELSYGYLRFEGNGKMQGKEKAIEEKTTKYPGEPSEIRTHKPRV